MTKKKFNPRYQHTCRRKYRARFKALGLPCAICGRAIDYDAPSDSKHPLSFVIDEILPVSRWREFGYPSAEACADDWNNLEPTHYICNSMKSNMTLEEFRRAQKAGQSPQSGQKTKKISLIDGEW